MHDAEARVAVELFDLAVFHIPEVGTRHVEFGSVPTDDTCGRLEHSAEGAPDRELHCDDVPNNVYLMQFPVYVRSQLAHERHDLAPLITSIGRIADHVDHTIVGEKVVEPFQIKYVALGCIVRPAYDIFYVRYFFTHSPVENTILFKFTSNF